MTMVKRTPAPPHPNGGQTKSTIVSAQPLEPEVPEDEQQEEAPSPPFYKRWKMVVPLVLACIIAVVAGAAYWLYARQYESTDDAFIAGRVTEINPHVAGYVAALYVDDNQRVNKGD